MTPARAAIAAFLFLALSVSAQSFEVLPPVAIKGVTQTVILRD